MYHASNGSKTQQEIADVVSIRFGHPISRRSVGDVIATKEKWMDCDANSSKKQRAGKNAELEAVLQMWFSSTRSLNTVITDAVLPEKGKQFGADLAITDFSYSNR